jgi:hypothetical protein
MQRAMQSANAHTRPSRSNAASPNRVNLTRAREKLQPPPAERARSRPRHAEVRNSDDNNNYYDYYYNY